jgi:predicted 2-oxoglutarate/Fe(II)-dependent dioxygenase YbiX
MMMAIKLEDELKAKLKREAQLSNKSQLEKQIQQKKERKEIAESLNNSMQRTFATGLPIPVARTTAINDYKDGAFSQTHFDGTPNHRNGGALGRRKSEERTIIIRDELRKQITSNEERKR